MKTPITMKRIRQHWQYSWWKYALLVCLTLLGWNLIYSITAYRPPQEKVVDVYLYGYDVDEEMQAYLDQVRAEEMPDMEQMEWVVITPDETYGSMVLSTRFAANEGEIYILPKTFFQNYATQGWFLELENIEGLVETLEGEGVNLERSWRMNTETGERHLYGIPLSALPGLAAHAVSSEEAWVCLSAAGLNDENAVKLLQILVRDMLEAPEEPEALDEAASTADPAAEPEAAPEVTPEDPAEEEKQ